MNHVKIVRKIVGIGFDEFCKDADIEIDYRDEPDGSISIGFPDDGKNVRITFIVS